MSTRNAPRAAAPALDGHPSTVEGGAPAVFIQLPVPIARLIYSHLRDVPVRDRVLRTWLANLKEMLP